MGAQIYTYYGCWFNCSFCFNIRGIHATFDLILFDAGAFSMSSAPLDSPHSEKRARNKNWRINKRKTNKSIEQDPRTHIAHGPGWLGGNEIMKCARAKTCANVMERRIWIDIISLMFAEEEARFFISRESEWVYKTVHNYCWQCICVDRVPTNRVYCVSCQRWRIYSPAPAGEY